MDRVECHPEKTVIFDFKAIRRELSPAEIASQYGVQMQLYRLAWQEMEKSGPRKVSAAIETRLLQFTEGGVRSVLVPDTGLSLEDYLVPVETAFAQDSHSLAFEARPSAQCQYCDFNGTCAPGRAFLGLPPTGAHT
jgi:hypothetical protein